MAGNIQDWDETPEVLPAEPRGMLPLKNLLILIMHNAAQDAAGRIRGGSNRASEQSERRRAMAEARRWLLSEDDHGPAIFVGRVGKVVQGASFVWICRMLDVDPKAAQEEICAIGWDAFCNRMTIATRSIRRGPEVVARKYSRNDENGPPRDDRESGDITLATRDENRATAI